MSQCGKRGRAGTGRRRAEGGRRRGEEEKRKRETRLTRQPHPHDIEDGLSVDGNIVSLEAFRICDWWGIGGGETSGKKE